MVSVGCVYLLLQSLVFSAQRSISRYCKYTTEWTGCIYGSETAQSFEYVRELYAVCVEKNCADSEKNYYSTQKHKNMYISPSNGFRGGTAF
jgi:hypothetical protein